MQVLTDIVNMGRQRLVPQPFSDSQDSLRTSGTSCLIRRRCQNSLKYILGIVHHLQEEFWWFLGAEQESSGGMDIKKVFRKAPELGADQGSSRGMGTK
jgi:hypothetical protein